MRNNLTKQKIKKLNSTQLCSIVTRLQFDEEAGCATADDRKEIILIEKILKERLIKMLGRDFYPPDRPTIAEVMSTSKPAPEPIAKATKAKVKTEGKCSFKVILSSSIGVKVAEFIAKVDSKSEAELEAQKMKSKLGLKKATHKIS